MSKNKPTAIQPRTKSKSRSSKQGRKDGQAAASSDRAGVVSSAAVREVVESVVIAFVLAFLFRTFEAEAFVIPTGSMAPTLMGRHKDLTCVECGFPFQVSASDEVDNETNRPSGQEVVACTCPNCRFTMDLTAARPPEQTYRSYKGDRILVGKFPYQFADPQRWDVAVFKYPGAAKTNYIKRIVGLPSQWVRISGGDVFWQPIQEDRAMPSPDGWTIARKPPRKMRAMLQIVYDNNYVLPWTIEKGWPTRWKPLTSGAEGDWVPSPDQRSFQTDGSNDNEVWIVYQHVAPSAEDWSRLQQGAASAGPFPQLVTDFTPYNTRETDIQPLPPYHVQPFSLDALARRLGLHWVGDLALEASLDVGSDSGQIVLELVEGGRRFQCQIDVATGKAALRIDGSDLQTYRPQASTSIQGPGEHKILFANIDDQLVLWIDDRLVKFDTETTYEPLSNTMPTRADLQPVRIGSHGASLRASNLTIYRDIYYIAAESHRPNMLDYDLSTTMHSYGQFPSESELREKLGDPDEWRRFTSARRTVEFKLQNDQFLVLGDNSAASKDSRLWGTERKPSGEYLPHYVSRELLIGKALAIYWPHSLDRIPYLNVPIRYFPNFKRMWLVR